MKIRWWIHTQNKPKWSDMTVEEKRKQVCVLKTYLREGEVLRAHAQTIEQLDELTLKVNFLKELIDKLEKQIEDLETKIPGNYLP